MPSVTIRKCACGTHVKVVYETDNMTTVRCPDLKQQCRLTHHVDGKVSNIWIEVGAVWLPLNVAAHVVAEASAND